MILPGQKAIIENGELFNANKIKFSTYIDERKMSK